MKAISSISKATGIAFFSLFFVGCLSQAQAEALNLPAIKQPTSAALLKQADAEYQSYLAHADNYFGFDPAKQAWPCNVSQAQLHKWTGTTSSAASQTTANPSRSKSSPVPAGKAAQSGYAYENVVFHPVKAACKNGKLDGNVELIYEGTRKAWGPTYQGSSRELAKVTMRMAEGRLLHLFEVKKSIDDSKAPSNQADLQKSMAPSKSASLRVTAAQHNRQRASSATIVMTDNPNPMYFLSRPATRNRVEKTFYAGTTLMSVEMRDKAGRSDGLAISYKDGRQVKTCFEHGRQIALKRCEK
jgi:hypothetical protein